ncbi:MAG: hypothetical protein B6I22_05525 [Desulfobacteraceae bacterium 4572_123]|nr:MAG: hypothetical protein B6I22_05525 [Desulfobacteraceae bacterium 4572_123]
MPPIKNKFHCLASVLIRTVLMAAFLTAIGCGDSVPQDPPPLEKAAESFTFFDLGVNTRLSKEVVQDLDDRLGSHSFEKRGIIDLSIQPSGALENNFSALHTLNRQLNSPVGERVEHDIRRYMYRYAARQGTPFNYIELVFSAQSGLPLYFRIKPVKGETGFMDTFHEKYGAPVVTKWPQAGVEFLSWTKAGDQLIVTIGTDRYGTPEYHITIFFTRNLNRLLALERSGRKKLRKQEVDPGKAAF